MHLRLSKRLYSAFVFACVTLYLIIPYIIYIDLLEFTMSKTTVFFYANMAGDNGLQHSRMGIHVASTALGARRICEKRGVVVKYSQLHCATVDLGRCKSNVIYRSEALWAKEVKAALNEGYDSIRYFMGDESTEYLCIFCAGRLAKIASVFGGSDQVQPADESCAA